MLTVDGQNRKMHRGISLVLLVGLGERTRSNAAEWTPRASIWRVDSTNIASSTCSAMGSKEIRRGTGKEATRTFALALQTGVGLGVFAYGLHGVQREDT